jgi:hypothetical protein
LPEAYFKARVREFWLADARKESVVFRIHRPGPTGYEAVKPDSDNFQASPVFGCAFRLDSRRDTKGNWVFDLRERQ